MNAVDRTIVLSNHNLMVNVCLDAVYALVRAVVDGTDVFAYGAMMIDA